MSLLRPFTPRGTISLSAGSAEGTGTVGNGNTLRVFNQGTQTIVVKIGTGLTASAGFPVAAGQEAFLSKAPSETTVAVMNLSAITASTLLYVSDGEGGR